ncbi:MAG: CRTAC1 family protein [Chitinophagaceae bacterium]|nr:MAG: CRTAC1 family protein [Chitinophagaceae bacterium]
MKFTCCSLLLLLLLSCNQKEKPKLFDLVTDSGISFNNTVTDGKDENSFYYRNYYNGGGVAIGDINNDGLCDVLMTSNMGSSKLFLNEGNFKFRDVTAGSGIRQDSMWNTGVVMADINSDGWLDIYVCSAGHLLDGNRRNKLYINNQKGGFVESAAQYGLDIKSFSTHASFFDYDLDGDLDCFLINNSPIPVNTLGHANRRDVPDSLWQIASLFRGGGDHLYRNDNGRFTEVTQQAGIHGSLISFGLGVSVGDLNSDGYPDVYVSNDFYERDYLYINQRDGTFSDEMESRMEQNSFASMGADLADINNDGYMDAFTTDMLPDDDKRLKTLGAFDNIDLYNNRIRLGFYHQFTKNCLYVNNREGKFIESAYYSGVSASDWSWGAIFFDADNDGRNDIYVCNGVNRDVTNLDFMDFFANDIIQRMVASGQKENVDSVIAKIPVHAVPNKVFQNRGGLRFEDAGKEWGMDQLSFSNGAAYGDLDNDGDLDLVVNNENMESFVYRNNSREQNKHNYISVMLKGEGKNSFAVGAKVTIYSKDSVFMREVMPSRGFQSSSDYKQVIGLGTLTAVDSMVITWPDRTYSHFPKPQLNKLHMIEQGKQQRYPVVYPPPPDLSRALFIEQPVAMEAHREDDHIDFYYERNIPELLSREGPAMATGDVNGDGLDDLYVGGAHNQPGQLYLQLAAGGFARNQQAIFDEFARFEDVTALFFDADRDGDLDLFIGAGGNNVEMGMRELEHRLYMNDGQGNFSLDTKAFPSNNMNIATAVSADFDGDGDPDLFVGARSQPYNYSRIPQSYLLSNDGKGHFTDVTAQMAPALKAIGMVTAADWGDLDKDGLPELIVTGEWMSTHVFSFNRKSGRMEEWKKTGLEKLKGWWKSVKAADLNGDGFADLVIGNIGQNFYLRPNQDQAVKFWVNDYDNNGNTEGFLTRTIAGKRDVPVFLKREVTDQFPALKKQNLKHEDFAGKTIQELFPAALLDKSRVEEFNYTSSVVAINDGKGGFTITELPQQVQLSSVNSIYIADVNQDKTPDLILGGNMFTFQPQFGRLDGSYGHVLANDGKGTFSALPYAQSGIQVREQIRNIATLKGRDRNYLVMVRNNATPKVYEVNNKSAWLKSTSR